MPTYSQLPGSLDLSLIAGDEFTFSAVFDLNLTGYTVTASVVNAETDAVLATPQLSITYGASSTVAVTLTEAQTTAIYAGSEPIGGAPTIRVRWHLRWMSAAGYTRTALSGLAKVARP